MPTTSARSSPRDNCRKPRRTRQSTARPSRPSSLSDTKSCNFSEQGKGVLVVRRLCGFRCRCCLLPLHLSSFGARPVLVSRRLANSSKIHTNLHVIVDNASEMNTYTQMNPSAILHRPLFATLDPACGLLGAASSKRILGNHQTMGATLSRLLIFPLVSSAPSVGLGPVLSCFAPWRCAEILCP